MKGLEYLDQITLQLVSHGVGMLWNTPKNNVSRRKNEFHKFGYTKSF